jgi:CHAP domain/Transglycosylase SLT domain
MNSREQEDRRAYWLLAPIALVLVVLLGAGMLAGLSLVWTRCASVVQAGQPSHGLLACQLPAASGLFQPSAEALREIPAPILRFYQGAGTQSNIPWPVLAGIGKLECDHARSTLPGCHSGANFAGAMGPMQFLAGTWNEYKVSAPGHTESNIYDPADAIYSAANDLAHSGAAGVMDLGSAAIAHAVFAYNHSLSYVADVLSLAHKYIDLGLPSGIASGPFGIVTGSGILAPLFSWVPAGGFPGIRRFTGAEDQCTFYAAYQWAGRNGQGVTWSGNAADWVQNAINQGYLVSSTPTVGAIAAWGAQSGYSSFGHVAIVTSVTPSDYTVAEQNYLGPGKVDQRRIPLPDARINGFIPLPSPAPAN